MAGGKGLTLLAAAVLMLAAGAPDDAWRRCAGADPDAALAACSAIIASGAESGARLAAAHYDRGIAYRNKSQYDRAHQGPDPDASLDRAIADYGRALALRPDYAEALANRAIAWFDRGEYDRSIADSDAAIRLRPDLAEAYNNRALAWYRQGRYDRALPDFDKTILLNKNYGNALITRSLPPFAPGGTDTVGRPEK
jgi:tetratricopeptide (TPR) repeat protein